MSAYGLSKIDLAMSNLFYMQFSGYKKNNLIESEEKKPFVRMLSNIQLEPVSNITEYCTAFSRNEKKSGDYLFDALIV